jgi:transposase-like protein
MKNVNQLTGRKGQSGRKSKYDISFRRSVANAYRDGNDDKLEVAKRYGVTLNEVKQWVRQFSSELSEKKDDIPMTDQEQQDFEALQKQVKALQKQLEHEQLRNFALETMADLAKTELGIDIRKNFGAKQPKE